MLAIPTKINYSTYQTFVLWLLIVSGPLKPMFTYFYLDFNFTLFAFILAVTDIIVGVTFRKHDIYLTKEAVFSLIVLFAFYSCMIVSLLYTESGSYAYEKIALFSINILFFIYPLFISSIDLEKICKWLLWIFLPIAIVFIVARFLYFSDLNVGKGLVRYEFYLIRHYYLGLSTTTAALVLLLVYLKKPLVYILIAIVTLLGLGGRGAFLFLLLTLFIWKLDKIVNYGSSFKISKKNFRYFLFGGGVLAAIVFFFFDRIFAVINLGLLRFKTLLDPAADQSTSGRIDRLNFSFESILGSPWNHIFGEGVGSFGILFTGLDAREYPHNIYLEVLFEMGIVGLLPFLLFTLLPFWYKSNTFYKVLLVYFFLNALKSGDLTSLWILFLAYGLVVFNPRIKI